MAKATETDIRIQRETTSWLRSRLDKTDCEAEVAEIVAELERRSKTTAPAHTPSPWKKARAGTDIPNTVHIEGPNGERVALCHERDADLIIAAPKLLKACIAAFDALPNECMAEGRDDDVECPHCILQEAIAEAKGRS